MERKEGRVKVGFSRFLWAGIVIVLCAAPCNAVVEVATGDTLNVGTGYPNEQINDWVDVYGTMNMYPGAYIGWYIRTNDGSTVNIRGGTVVMGTDVAAGAQVTVYGTYFEIGGTEYYPGDEVAINYYNDGPLTVVYEGGTQVDLIIDCQEGATVTLAAPGPVDPVQLIQDLIDKVASFNLHQGIDNSLDAKLDAALNALDDVNANNDVAAINTLQAFINAVEAQRDNKITDAQATELIADAQAIIDLLSA